MEGAYGPAIQALAIVAFVVVFNFLVRILLNRLSVRFEEQKRVWTLSFVSALQKPLSGYVWFVAAIVSVDIFTTAFFNLRVNDLDMILHVGFILAVGWFFLRWNNHIVKHMMEKSAHHEINMTLGKVDLISKIGKGGIIFMTLFLLMEVTGRNMQTLLAFGGIGGLALAFASQQVIANFFGGMMIYFTQPFTVGESVNLPEKKIEGHIESIGWYLTRIRSEEKKPIYVPNSVFSQTIVITSSRQSHERILHSIELRYEDIGVVEPIVKDIKELLLSSALVDQKLPIEVYFIGFSESHLNIQISAYFSTKSTKDFKTVRQDIFLRVAKIINDHGAQIATSMSKIDIQGALLRNNLIVEKPVVT